eukprot:m.211399 g.211399  ORF g.211399 m.211399 type:complete len:843 (+) comp18318_c0_seq1:197-2725(+)
MQQQTLAPSLFLFWLIAEAEVKQKQTDMRTDLLFSDGGCLERHRLEQLSSPAAFFHLLLQLLHAVEGAAGLEPLELRLVEGVVEGDLDLLAALLGDDGLDRLAGGQLGQAKQRDLVALANLGVVSGVAEGQGEHALLLEVGLVDAGEALDDDGAAAEVARLEGGVLARAALAVVLVADDHPVDVLALVEAGHRRDGVVLAGDGVEDRVGLAVGLVDGADQHVVADVVQVAAELEPRAGHADVVGRALALGLDEDLHVLQILAVPAGEGREQLQARALRVDLDRHRGRVGRRRLVRVHAAVKALGGQLCASRVGKLELLAVGAGQRVLLGVEVQAASSDKGGDELRGGDKGVRLRVAVVAAGEVAVVRGDDAVLDTLLHVLAIPLADAGAAGVGEHNTAKLVKGRGQAVALNGGADLLGAGRDGELGLGLDAVVQHLLGHAGRALHVLVGGVGAAADEADAELDRPVVLLELLGKLGERVGQIRGEGAVDVRLQRAEVNLDDLVVRGVLVGREQLLVLGGQVGNAGAVGLLQVGTHALGEGEDGGGGANLRTHVADGGHARAGEAADARAKVLDDGAGAALDGEDAGELEDDVLGRGPALELALEVDANDLGALELPGQASHHVDGVSAADADAEAAEAAAVRGVAVCADDEGAGEGVVLQDDLVDDAAAGLPEANAVLGRGGGQEVVDLLVLLVGAGQILGRAELGLDQMVAVHRAGHSNARQARGDELQHSHLRGGVLHGHAVRAEAQVALAADNLLLGGLVDVAIENLLREGERAVEALGHDADVLGKLAVVDVLLLVEAAQGNLTRSGSVEAHAGLTDCANGLHGTKHGCLRHKMRSSG